MKEESPKAIFYALAANFGIAVCKFGAAAFTGSGSMFAEAIHSTADCGNQLLLLLGLKRAKRPPSPDHPMGYGKETYFWSFLVAIMLFSVGGLFSLYEGWHKLHEPEELRNLRLEEIDLVARLTEVGEELEILSLDRAAVEHPRARAEKTIELDDLAIVEVDDRLTDPILLRIWPRLSQAAAQGAPRGPLPV